MIQFVVIFSLLLVSLGFIPAFGTVDQITTDKAAYYEGEIMHVSGTVSTELSVTSVSVIVFDPARSTFVAVAPAIANSDGTFSVSIRIGGPLWTSYGNYPVKATSENTSKETIIEYMESTTSDPTSEPPPSTSDPTSEPPPSTSDPTPEPPPSTSDPTPEPPPSTSDPELEIPAPFVDTTKYPQSYVDRYNNEINYKEWFDANYPQYSSIYEAVGLKEPVSMPEWVRNNAEWWATGAITDSTFITGIEFMLENNIIVISNISQSGNVSDDNIPEWVRNNAHWWSQNLISENEFTNSLKFLIQEGIITIN